MAKKTTKKAAAVRAPGVLTDITGSISETVSEPLAGITEGFSGNPEGTQRVLNGEIASIEAISPTAPETTIPPPKNLGNLKPWKPGQSGNPAGRPKIEPRVRRYARKYDRAMCKTLAEIAMDKQVPPGERRKAAMDLIAVGSGRPAVIQEVGGRAGEPLGALVNLNFGMNTGQPMLSPEQAYRLMVAGAIEADPTHPSFRPALEDKTAP